MKKYILILDNGEQLEVSPKVKTKINFIGSRLCIVDINNRDILSVISKGKTIVTLNQNEES